jgi:hypothetical protein
MAAGCARRRLAADVRTEGSLQLTKEHLSATDEYTILFTNMNIVSCVSKIHAVVWSSQIRYLPLPDKREADD